MNDLEFWIKISISALTGVGVFIYMMVLQNRAVQKAEREFQFKMKLIEAKYNRKRNKNETPDSRS